MTGVQTCALPISGFPAVVADPQARDKCQKWLAALGGRDNVVSLAACAETRLRIVLRESGNYDREELLDAGVKGIMPLPDGVIHLLTGLGAHQYEIELQALLKAQ